MSAVLLTERDAWLRHYLGQTMTAADLDEAMRFNNRRPSTEITRLMRQGVHINRKRLPRRDGSMVVWHYPVKRLIATVRANGIVVEQGAARWWVEQERAAQRDCVIDDLRERLRDSDWYLNETTRKLAEAERQRDELAARLEAAIKAPPEPTLRILDEPVRLALRAIAELQDVRAAPGVYLLYGDDRRVRYVGISHNCIRRLSEHTGKPFAFARMYQVDDRDQQRAIENALIKALAPEWNIQGVLRERSVAA